jgi:general secretion pathway protein M
MLTSVERPSLSPRETLAIFAYFGVVAALLSLSQWFVNDLEMRSGRIAAAQMRLDSLKERSLAPSARGANSGARRSLFLGGPDITIAGAALEQRVKSVVEKSGGVLTSSQVELDGPDAKDGFLRLTASLEVDQPGLQSILYDIEAGDPYLFVEKLSIQSPENFGEPETGRFRMTVTVLGQWRPSR